MEFKLVRGVAADLSQADERGRVVCRVGERTVRLHRELASAARAGDDVLIGGELHQDVVHAFALKNFTQRKLSKVDLTYHVLGAGLGAYIALLGLIFSGQISTGDYSGQLVLNLVMLAGGGVMVVVVLTRLWRIVKLTRWVDGVEE